MLNKLVFEYYDRVDSTNDRIKARAHAGAEEGLVITADVQTAGKGRVGRSWKNPTGVSIATSALIKPTDIPIESVPTITTVAGMAVRAAIADVTGLEASIKWPNDVVIGGKKICGILTEMEMQGKAVWYAVCGIGINVHNKDFAPDIAFKATSIDIEMEKCRQEGATNLPDAVHRQDITEAVWRYFSRYYNLFLQTGDLSHLREEYEAHLANKGCKVRVEDPAGPYEAICLGITDRGELIVETDGMKKIISTGEVSVRGIYGYV